MRDMQKESAMTPNSCGRPAPPKSGATGGRCHTLHERPGTVWYPKSKSNVEASFAAHMPMLREGKDQKTEDQSKSRETFARRESWSSRAPTGTRAGSFNSRRVG